MLCARYMYVVYVSYIEVEGAKEPCNRYGERVYSVGKRLEDQTFHAC